MNDFSVYLTAIGGGGYNAFIQNNSSDADFIRIIIGYTEIFGGKRTAKVINSWIISPLQSSCDPVFIQRIHQSMMNGRRVWIAFESMKRNKPRAIPLKSFVALTPVSSKWKKTIGSSTNCDIQPIDSVKRLDHLALLD